MSGVWGNLKQTTDIRFKDFFEVGGVEAEACLGCALAALGVAIKDMPDSDREIILNDIFGIQVDVINSFLDGEDGVDLAGVPASLSLSIKELYRGCIKKWNSSITVVDVAPNHMGSDDYTSDFCFQIALAIMNSIWFACISYFGLENTQETLSTIPSEWKNDYAFLVYDFTHPELRGNLGSQLANGDLDKLGRGVLFASYTLNFLWLNGEIDSEDEDNNNYDNNELEEPDEEDNEVEPEAEDNEANEAEPVESSEPEEEAISEGKAQLINSYIKNLMVVFEGLYAPCFVREPVGIITEGEQKANRVMYGVLGIKENSGDTTGAKNTAMHTTMPEAVFGNSIYSIINTTIGGKLKAAPADMEMGKSFFDADGNLVYNYCPNFHARNVFGVYKRKGANGSILDRASSWTEFKPILEQIATKILTSILVNYSDIDQARISKVMAGAQVLFESCIIMQEFDLNKSMLLRLSLSTTPQVKSFYKHIPTNIKSNAILLGKSVENVEIKSSEQSGVLFTTNIVLDKQAYDTEILFAYKAIKQLVDAGQTVSASAAVIGRREDGKDEIKNFLEQSCIVTGILAGPRSGKGVLTLSILATLIASSLPFVYLDHKPDMAPMLWRLEKSTGVRILAPDFVSNYQGEGGTRFTSPRNTRGKGSEAGDLSVLPKLVRESSVADYIRELGYIKGIQLMLALARARTEGTFGFSISQNPVVFILDEALAASEGFKLLKLESEALLNSKALKKPDGEDAVQAVEYLTKLINLMDTLMPAVRDFFRQDAMSRVKCIVLGQGATIAEWSTNNSQASYTPYGFLVSKAQYTIAGANLGKFSAGLSLNKTGQFVAMDGPVAGTEAARDAAMGSARRIKPYFVMLENDFNSDGTPGYLTNNFLSELQDENDRARVRDELWDSNTNSPILAAGFPGLISMMSDLLGGDVSKSLGSGYEAIEKLMESVGLLGEGCRYTQVEDFLFDFSYESLIRSGEFSECIKTESKLSIQGLTVDSVDDFEDSNNEYAYDGGNGSDNANNEEGYSEPQATGRPMPYHESNDVYSEPQTAGRPVPYRESNEAFAPSEEVMRGNASRGGASPIEYSSPSRRSAFAESVTPDLELKDSVFDTYADGHQWSTVERMDALSETSSDLIELISNQFGGKDRVTRFYVTANGGLIVNNINFSPKMSEGRMNALPLDVKYAISSGNWSELFNFYDLKGFKNLQILSIENDEVAEFRAAHELGLWGNDWRKLFKKFKRLQVIEIGATRYTANGQDERGTGGERQAALKVQDSIRKGFGLPSIVPSSMGRCYQNEKIPVGVKVAGTVLGVGAMWGIASLLGAFALPIGLLMGSRVLGKNK